eukprot:scaffold162043_cov32-Prasinocladus_malaysianus.AAC.1
MPPGPPPRLPHAPAQPSRRPETSPRVPSPAPFASGPRTLPARPPRARPPAWRNEVKFKPFPDVQPENV